MARRGAVLYFVLAELSGMDVMYQFSLAWFQRMFASCVASPSSDTSSIASSAATAAAFGSGKLRSSSPQAPLHHDSAEDLLLRQGGSPDLGKNTKMGFLFKGHSPKLCTGIVT